MFFSLLAAATPEPWFNKASPATTRCVEWTSGNFAVAKIQGLECLFKNVVTVVATLAGLALLMMLISGAIKYLTSGGDPKAAEAAKGTLTYAILGLILIVAAYLILSFLSAFTGITGLKGFLIPGGTP